MVTKFLPLVVAFVAGVVAFFIRGGRAPAFLSRTLPIAAFVFVASLTLDITLTLCNGFPQPRIHDEYCYLLSADTFAHGRLTNPTPEFAGHFQSPHILLTPSYQSKYPPGQALSLAVGELIGDPIFGVWLTRAAANAAVFLALVAIASPGWALLGALLVTFMPQTVIWGQCFWGGGVAELGGALLLGAWLRLTGNAPRPALHAGLYAAGLAILANSRPFEGLLLSLPFTIDLVLRLRQSRFVTYVPALLILAATALGMARYNAAVTGNALTMPFAAYTKQFDVYPKFWLLGKKPEPTYPNELMRQVHTEFEAGDYDAMRTAHGLVKATAEKVRTFGRMFVRPGFLLLPLLFALPFWKDRRLRVAAAAVGAVFVGVVAENIFLEHYAAPAVAAFVLILVAGLEKLSNVRWPNIGRAVVAAVVVGTAISGVLATRPDPDEKLGRDDFVNSTQLRTGRHLVFVRELPGHDMHDEWVYNGANLSAAPIIWAHELANESDAALAAANADRTPWVVVMGKQDGHEVVTLLPFRAGKTN